MNTRQKKMRRMRAGQHSWTYMLLPLLTLLFFSSCSVLLPGTDLKPAATPPIVTIQPIQALHQAYRTIVIGLDISGSYPRFVFEQAKRAVVDSIYRLVQPNEDGATVYINWITDNSWSPNSTAIPPIVIPALPADPAMPVLKPVPTPTGDPYQDAQAAKRVKAENARTMANYYALLKQNHAQLALVRSQVKRQTDTLARLEPPVDTISTDIYGFVERASQRLQGTQGTASSACKEHKGQPSSCLPVTWITITCHSRYRAVYTSSMFGSGSFSTTARMHRFANAMMQSGSRCFSRQVYTTSGFSTLGSHLPHRACFHERRTS